MTDVMPTRLIKDLKIGDMIKGEADGEWLRLRKKERSRLFRAAGGCFRLDMTIIEGAHVGKQVNDQHFPGDMTVMVRE